MFIRMLVMGLALCLLTQTAIAAEGTPINRHSFTLIIPGADPNIPSNINILIDQDTYQAFKAMGLMQKGHPLPAEKAKRFAELADKVLKESPSGGKFNFATVSTLNFPRPGGGPKFEFVNDATAPKPSADLEALFNEMRSLYKP